MGLSEFESTWREYSQRSEIALRARLAAQSDSADNSPSRLHQAMEYACLGGGKRFRAVLVYASGKIAGATLENLDSPACAVEMVHAYSLVHDDLPAMDDDDLRRGQATCHIAYDEATAVLVGDALQSRAFEILSSGQSMNVAPVQRMRMVEELARAIGSLGMAGGQSLDMEATGKVIEFVELEKIHQRKTGALIRASATIGALAVEEVDENLLDCLDIYASAIGLAFQITDDILDETSSSDKLGKSSGADHRMNKSTYVSLLGLDAAKSHVDKLSRQAIESIQGLGDNRWFLEQLSQFVVTRSF